MPSFKVWHGRQNFCSLAAAILKKDTTEGPALCAVSVKEGLDQDSEDKSSRKMGGFSLYAICMHGAQVIMLPFPFLLSQPAAALEFVEICEKGSPGKDLESPEIQIFRRTSHWINYTQVLEICIPS